MSLDLEPIKKRCEEATPGPWRKTADVLRGGGCVSTRFDDLFVSYANPPTIQTSRDCDFIAHSREDVPALIAEVENLMEQLQQTSVQLAGCSVAALGYHQDTKQGDYGWSASMGDIQRLRQRLEAAERVIKAVQAMKAACHGPHYWEAPCEYGEAVDDSLAAWEEVNR